VTLVETPVEAQFPSAYLELLLVALPKTRGGFRTSRAFYGAVRRAGSPILDGWSGNDVGPSPRAP